MNKRAFCLSLAVLALSLPATAASASEWEPEREYHDFAVAPADDVRYGGYTEGGQGYIDVLDRMGNVMETIQVPGPRGMGRLDVSGDLLIASYGVDVAEAPFNPSTGISLYRDGIERARAVIGGYAPFGLRGLALSDEWVFFYQEDTGIEGWARGFPLEGIPPVGPAPGPPEGGTSLAHWHGSETFGITYLAASADELFVFRTHDEPAAVDAYSMPPNPELIETIVLEDPGLDFTLRDASEGVAGSFVMSGSTDPSIEWCSIWTYAPDGSLQDCFFPKLGGADRSDPFAVDGCGGIVVADVEAEAGVLTGHKLIPSDRDPGCFVDSLDSTFVSNIAAVGRAGITRGCNPPDNDRYCPDDLVTRGQMAALLHRALGDVLTPTRSVEFTDDDGNMFEADIEWLGGVGVTRGCNPPVNDRYCPNDHVTRGQMAAFLARALGYTDDGGGDLFIDDDDSIFELDIDKLSTAGVTKGCNPPVNDRFCPNQFVTRGQMAAFLDRALNG